MPAVDAEMRIGRDYSAARELLGHADQAGIGQGHGQAPVSLLEFQQPFDFVLQMGPVSTRVFSGAGMLSQNGFFEVTAIH